MSFDEPEAGPERRPPGWIALPAGGRIEDFQRGDVLTHAVNSVPPGEPGQLLEALRALLGELGDGALIRPPLVVDYGFNIKVGRNTFINAGAVLLDMAPITIGPDTRIGPGVQLLTPTHPVDPVARKQVWGGAAPVTIGANVWLGGGVIVCPGVTIGDNAVIGAGAVVTCDVPSAVLAAGNPARIIRAL